MRDGWVYFVRSPIDLPPGSVSPGPAIWRVRVTGGEAQLVQAARKSNVAALRKQILALQAARPRLAAAARKVGFRSCSQGGG